MPLISDRSNALTRIEELLDTDTSITDVGALELYEIAFEKILPEHQESWANVIGELRWRFVRSNPKDEEAVRECFRACLLNGDLDHAVKVRL